MSPEPFISRIVNTIKGIWHVWLLVIIMLAIVAVASVYINHLVSAGSLNECMSKDQTECGLQSRRCAWCPLMSNNSYDIEFHMNASFCLPTDRDLFDSLCEISLIDIQNNIEHNFIDGITFIIIVLSLIAGSKCIFAIYFTVYVYNKEKKNISNAAQIDIEMEPQV